MRDRRQENVARLRTEFWDVLVVGGGINGAGIARDLMLRGAGIKVALVDKAHFSSGTSGKNSQLIHGGLRYLKYFDFGLVREALRERATLLEIAGALVHPLKFLIPCYGLFDRYFYGAGLTLYDALAGERSIGPHQSLRCAETRGREPELNDDGLRGGLLFHDATVNSARLVLENILDAEARGACVANYVEAHWDGGNIEVRDTLSGESFPLRATRIVDATGAWSSGAPLRRVRGSHLIFPRIQKNEEAIAWFDKQGRIIFLIPWGENNDLTLVGTTDVDHNGGPDDVRISAEEAEYLTAAVHRLFPSYRRAPVSSYSSLRPLVQVSGRSATSTSREHSITQTPDGVIHISGGKYTTYRLMSEQLVDILVGERYRCHTAETPLNIATPPQDRVARVHMAVEREFARKLPDLLHVSTYWGYERPIARDWIEPLAREMAGLLGWTESRIQQEIAYFLP